MKTYNDFLLDRFEGMRARLKAEGVDTYNKAQAIKALEPCVLGHRLIELLDAHEAEFIDYLNAKDTKDRRAAAIKELTERAAQLPPPEGVFWVISR